MSAIGDEGGAGGRQPLRARAYPVVRAGDRHYRAAGKAAYKSAPPRHSSPLCAPVPDPSAESETVCSACCWGAGHLQRRTLSGLLPNFADSNAAAWLYAPVRCRATSNPEIEEMFAGPSLAGPPVAGVASGGVSRFAPFNQHGPARSSPVG
jgi:hypothetical protein